MDRRRFIQASAAGLTMSVANSYAAEVAAESRKRVGLIGCGWYGKCDLLRLLQVAPVDVVSLCDVDRNMLADAAEQVASRQESKKKPRTYSDYRELLNEKDLDIVLINTPDHWHALPMIQYEFEQYPEDRTEKDLERHVAPAIRGHMRDFLANIATRGRPVADIEEGHISSASCILANTALSLGRTLDWDPDTHLVVGDDEANQLLRRPYRAPWVHPEPDQV